MVHLITGYAGFEHIMSEDDGSFNAAFIGDGQYVMEIGNQFAASIINNNTVRILDGDGLMYGRHFRIKPNTYEDLTIETGTAGMKRADLICMTYEKNANDETESVYLKVVKGTETSGTATLPNFTDGNILEGATLNHMPLYKVSIDGVVLSGITPLFDTVPTYKTLAEHYEEQFKTACDNHLQTFLNLAYPVGSIYMSANNVNPGTLFGGTWTSWGAGRVPVGVNPSDSDFNTVEKAGGSKELQKHAHDFTPSGSIGNTTATGTVNGSGALKTEADGIHAHYLTYEKDGKAGTDTNRVYANGQGTNYGTQPGTAIDGAHEHAIPSHAHTFTGKAHNHTFTGSKGTTAEVGTGTSGNLQPYITCYMWKRTA